MTCFRDSREPISALDIMTYVTPIMVRNFWLCAKRLEQCLPKLIHLDQTGFVHGRYIGQNIRLLNDIMDYTDAMKLSGILVDFEKAFDTLEWPFILKAL